VTVLLVRHAEAGRRGAWTQPDHLRPLTSEGHDQAAGLVALLRPFGIGRILSSPFVRCVQTVEPLAAELAVGLETHDLLAEGTRRRAAELVDVDAEETVVLCSHGDVVPDLLVALAPAADLGRDPRCEKASTWVVERGGAAVRYLPPPG
jgi:8-oxo-dGTP diphosphatase